MCDLDLFLQIAQVKGHACLISYRYIKHCSKEPFELQCPSLHHWCIWWMSRPSWDIGGFYIFLWQWVTTKGQGQLIFKQKMREFAVLYSRRSSVSGLPDWLTILATGTQNKLLFQLYMRLCLHVFSSLGSSETFNSSQCFSTNYPLYHTLWPINLDIG